MEAYILGAYLTIIVYGFLLESSTFREYMLKLIELILSITNRKKIDPYVVLIVPGFIFAFLSWIGLIIEIIIYFDYRTQK